MEARTNTEIETRRGGIVSVEARNDEEIILRVIARHGGRLTNTSVTLHPDEARALSLGIDAAVGVIDAGIGAQA